jgi:acyl dehydratase
MRRVIYVVTCDSVQSYAHAVGERNPIHFDERAAHAAGYRSLVAPPMFAAVYAGTAFRRLLDDELGPGLRPFAVHGGQALRWFGLVCAGDEVDTMARVTSPLGPAGRHRALVVQTVSRNRRGELVSLGRWTTIVRTPSHAAPERSAP